MLLENCWLRVNLIVTNSNTFSWHGKRGILSLFLVKDKINHEQLKRTILSSLLLRNNNNPGNRLLCCHERHELILWPWVKALLNAYDVAKPRWYEFDYFSNKAQHHNPCSWKQAANIANKQWKQRTCKFLQSPYASDEFWCNYRGKHYANMMAKVEMKHGLMRWVWKEQWEWMAGGSKNFHGDGYGTTLHVQKIYWECHGGHDEICGVKKLSSEQQQDIFKCFLSVSTQICTFSLIYRARRTQYYCPSEQ